jgi:L-ribulose-5-phosphate 4-epimerase
MSALEALRQRVAAAHHDLVRHGLVLFSWGNASGVDRALGLVVIKPSGVDCQQLRPEQLVTVRLDDGAVVRGPGLGEGAPSSDTPTHLALYRAWGEIGAIVHTHSEYATSAAQAGLPIPALGTTHADCFHGDVPCTRPLTASEIAHGYEASTAAVIIACVAASGQPPLAVPAALVSQHAPFAWGATIEQAVEHAAVLERCARMLVHTRSLNAEAARMPQHLLDKHWRRKHGPAASYGQPGGHGQSGTARR